MRKLLMFIITALLINNSFIFSFPSKEVTITPMEPVPFSRGVSFTRWFEEVPKSAQEIHNRYTEQDFSDVKQLGVDVIRLPIDFYLFTSGAPNYTIDPLLFKLLDEALDWAEKYKIYIIMDCHPENQPVIDKTIINFILPLWRQMAEHFKNQSEYVIYEILNEPQGISSGNWGKIQGDVINEIRKIDQRHWIVIGGTNYNSFDSLSSLPKYTEKRLLYTFHFYDPYIFTNQGVYSDAPSLASLAGVPFPYDRKRMPEIPPDLRGTSVDRYLRISYPTDGTKAALGKELDTVAKFSKQRNVPVFCGEFGVLRRTSLPDDRVRWHKAVRELFEERNIPWIKWSYYDCYGIFNSQLDGAFRWASAGDINVDLDVELVKALSLTPVPQRQRGQLQTSFSIYEDSFNRGVSIYDRKHSTIDLYYTPAAEGKYAIQLGNLRGHGGRSDGMTLLLSVMDLTYLAQNDYVLEFKAKTDKPLYVEASFYNFMDNINWQIGYKIDQTQLPPDGNWHTIRIPLKNMKTNGQIDISTDQYTKSSGRPVFWTKINMLEFIITQEDSNINNLYLDSIKITK